MGGCSSSEGATKAVSGNSTSAAVVEKSPNKAIENPGDAGVSPQPKHGFTYQTGTCALEFWEPIKELGEGSISSIHMVRRRERRIHVPYKERVDIMSLASNSSTMKNDDELLTRRSSFSNKESFALKSIIKAYVQNDKFLQEMRDEIYTMSHLDHPNIVKVYEAYERKRHIYLIMEYCRGGDLWARQLNETATAAVVRKILLAVSFLHDHNVVHRDLKLENIMFDQPGPNAEVKIIDFGLATRYLSNEHKQMTDRVGTLYSMAPQVLQGVYDAKCDLWSIGVITYVLLSGGTQPFWGPPREIPWDKRKKIMIDRIMRCEYMRMKGTTWDGVSEEAKRFVKSLLQIDPAKRPSAKEALASKWMKLHEEDKPALIACTPKSLQRDQLHRFERQLRIVLTNKLSEEALMSLKAGLEKHDETDEGRVSLEVMLRYLLENNLEQISLAALHELANGAGKDAMIDYTEVIFASLESKGRRESERMAEALAEMDIDSSGMVAKARALLILYRVVPDHTLDIVKETFNEDDTDQISCQVVLDLISKQMADRIHTLSSHHDSSDEVKNLVDAKNAVIPGGRNDPSERPEYVFDASTNSVRKYAEKQ
jgi:calcium-dependent protein kinase